MLYSWPFGKENVQEFSSRNIFKLATWNYKITRFVYLVNMTTLNMIF